MSTNFDIIFDNFCNQLDTIFNNIIMFEDYDYFFFNIKKNKIQFGYELLQCNMDQIKKCKKINRKYDKYFCKLISYIFDKFCNTNVQLIFTKPSKLLVKIIL